ncbi:hypothetical protein [Streptomyces lavenduligriseus]|nr:hypothetical protein [Streptomyces lavenduligriseus]
MSATGAFGRLQGAFQRPAPGPAYGDELALLTEAPRGAGQRSV